MPTNTPPLTVEEWTAEARAAGANAAARPVRRFVGDVAGEAQADGLVPIIMSTASEDRAGDTVSDDGWTLTDYLKNPVLLWSHDQSIPAIGRMEGIGTGPLRGSMRFTPREVNAFGYMVGGLYTHGFLKAGSVGFMPLEYDFTDHGVRFKKQALLEFSCCNVPMNGEALASAKSLGIDVGLFLPFAEKTLDGDKAAPFWMAEKQAMAVYRSLTGPRFQVPAAAPVDPLAVLTEQVKSMSAAIDGLRNTVAGIRAATHATVNVIAEPAPKPATVVRSGITPEKAAELTAAAISKKWAELTGRAPQD